MEFQKWEITKNGGTSYDYWDQNLSIDPHLDGNYSIKAFFTEIQFTTFNLSPLPVLVEA